jgi:hypothetical protein
MENALFNLNYTINHYGNFDYSLDYSIMEREDGYTIVVTNEHGIFSAVKNSDLATAIEKTIEIIKKKYEYTEIMITKNQWQYHIPQMG